MILGVKKIIGLDVLKIKVIFLMLVVLKIIERKINLEKRITLCYLFGFLKICEISMVKEQGVYKKTIHILGIPVIKVMSGNNKIKSKLFGVMTIYSSYLRNNDNNNNNSDNINDKYILELNLLVKSVSSGLREVKRLENKLNDIIKK